MTKEQLIKAAKLFELFANTARDLQDILHPYVPPPPPQRKQRQAKSDLEDND